MRLGGLLARTTKAFSRALTDRFRAAGEDISIEQWMILVRLWHQEGFAQTDLGNACNLDKTLVTRAVTSLELRNIVVRIPDPKDKRINRIYLTHLGKQLRERLMPIVDEVHHAALQGVSPSDLDQVRSCLFLMLKNLETDPSAPPTC